MRDQIYPNMFYGDNIRWFIGVIEDINDPMKLGRVRTRIYGIHSIDQFEIQTSDLPWAQTLIPSTEGGVSGIGRSSGLQPGAKIFGVFLDGATSQLPIVLGSLPKIEALTPIQRGKGPNLNSSVGPGFGTTGERNKIISTDLTGNSNAEIAFNFFVSYGFTPKQSAGIVGNLMQESGPGLNTSIKSFGSEQSFGIAQWNKGAGRYKQLLEFAADIGKHWTLLETQLRFIIWELETHSYLGLSAIRSSQTIIEAVIAFEKKYERPSTPNRTSRIAYARDIYVRMLI